MTINEQTLQELAKQFGLALNWGDKNVIPYLQDLAQRVITYEFRSSIFWIVIGSILILMGIGVIILGFHFGADAIGLAICAAVVLWMFGIGIVGAQINDIILCGTLPEKILLRYIQTK